MSIVSILAVSLLAAASRGVQPDANSVQPVAFTNNAPSVAVSAAGRDPDRPAPSSGSRAPDFQYQSYDELWQHLHNVLEHGDVLLVFGASDVDLRSLEREREALLKTGVVPLAVVEKNDRDVWASVRRLGLTYSLLADPKGAIGQQYGVYEPSLGRSRNAWFVIDTKGKVRQSSMEMPSTSWATVAANALGHPLDGSTRAASKR